MKKTKIVATYGPAISSAASVRKLVQAGVNTFRINCSHGKGPDFIKAADTIHKGCEGSPYPVGVLFDIAGPKLRIGRFDGKITVKAGSEITLAVRATEKDKSVIGVSQPEVIDAIKKGNKVFIDDGSLIFNALSSRRGKVVLRAVNSGVLLPGKGINLPDSDIKLPTISEKDREDVKTAIRVKADFIALSFVRKPSDIQEARRLVSSFGGDQRIIAKLEKREAIDNLEAILKTSDGVMIARGDLGVELPFEELPRLQKRIIRLANQYHKPVIVATQMLESMRFNPRATRAEVNDVASAVFDFVDAVMLSAETATGKYPLQAVKTMDKIIRSTEEQLVRPYVRVDTHVMRSESTQAIARGVLSAVEQFPTKAIIAFTSSGYTADVISNLFPSQPIIALSTDKRVMYRLTLIRGVYPAPAELSKTIDEVLATVRKVVRKYKVAADGDKVIITGGAPFGTSQPTNLMMFYELPKKRRKS